MKAITVAAATELESKGSTMLPPATDLESFLRDKVAERGRSLLVLALQHMDTGSRGAMLDRIEVRGSAPQTSELSDRIMRQARAHAEALGSDERYTVAAFVSGEVVGECFFSVDGGRARAYGRTPTPEAFLRHGLGHIERMTEIHERAAAASIMTLARLADRQADELERLRKTHTKTTETLEALLDMRAARELEALAEERKQKRADRAVDIAANVGQVLAAHFAGADPVTRLLDRLPPEALPAIAEALDDEGKAALRELCELGRSGQAGRAKILELVRPAPEPPSSGASSSDAPPEPSP